VDEKKNDFAYSAELEAYMKEFKVIGNEYFYVSDARAKLFAKSKARDFLRDIEKLKFIIGVYYREGKQVTRGRNGYSP